MIAKSILTAGCFIALSCATAAAVDDSFTLQGPRRGSIMPQSSASQRAVAATVENRNALELSETDVRVEYGSDGRIKNVTYQDGTSVEYVYQVDARNEIQSCTMNADNGVSIKYSRANDKIAMTVADTSTGPGRVEESPVIIIDTNPSGGLEKISRKPVDVDFKALRSALDDVAKQKADAYQEYLKNTEQYYSKVIARMKEKASALKAEGVALGEILRQIGSAQAVSAKTRQAVDEAVARIRAEAERTEIDRPAAEGFMKIENEYRAEFLGAAMEMYNEKIEKAMAYLNSVIDGLLNSKIAVYLNVNKKKMDVIIKLPQEAAK